MLDQIIQITLLNLRNLPSRIGSSSVIVVGIAGVVGVMVAILAMAGGFRSALENTADETRAIVMRDGASGEMSSGMSRESVDIITTLENVRLASPELFVIVDIPKRSNGDSANLVVRGVSQAAIEIRPKFRLSAGRMFELGKRELIAGRGASAEFEKVEVGNRLQMRDAEWEVVGLFETGGDAHESEVWGDLPVTQSTFRRGSVVNTLRIRFDSPDMIDGIKARIAEDPRLDLKATSESDYYSAQSESLSSLITSFGYTVAIIMAVGAVFAALNTMYSAVSTRSVEIATLRALGFGGLPVMISVMIEALALALIGGLLGGLVAYMLFNGMTVSTLNDGSFSQVAFDFVVDAELIYQGLVWAICLGLIGGLFPAARAARLPIATALRGD